MATVDGRGRGADSARRCRVLKYSDSTYFLLHPAGVVRPDEGEEEGGNATGRLGDSSQATGGAATPASMNEELTTRATLGAASCSEDQLDLMGYNHQERIILLYDPRYRTNKLVWIQSPRKNHTPV